MVIGYVDEVEDLRAPAFRDRVATRHQLCLPQTGVHQGSGGALVVEQRCDRLSELDAALLLPSGGPQVTPEPFVTPRGAERRWTALERGSRQLYGSFVTDGRRGDVGGLPQSMAAIDRGGTLTDRIPQLEGTLEVTECCSRSHRLCRIGRGEQGRERFLVVTRTVEVESQFARTIRSSQHLGGLL